SGVSADGRTSVGYFGYLSLTNIEPYFERDGFQIGTGANNGADWFEAVSRNGVVAVGAYGAPQAGAVRWTEDGGVEYRPPAPGAGSSRGRATNVAGSVVVWTAQLGGGTEAFVWTSSGGTAALGFLGVPPPPAFPYSEALGVSGDGRTVVGSSTIS